jgi:hypothetical protein
MTVYYNLQMNGTAITDWGNYEVAAFVGDDCRGVGETMAAVVGEETVHYGYLRVRSNAEAGGETVSFKVYVKNANKEVAIGDEANITFTPNGAEGLPSSPKALNIRAYQLSFTDNIVGGVVYGAGSYYAGAQATARAVARSLRGARTEEPTLALAAAVAAALDILQSLVDRWTHPPGKSPCRRRIPTGSMSTA